MDINCGIYLIISPSNGRYIGSSCSIKKRFNRYKNLSCNNQYALVSSFRKYGVENHKFKILYYCEKSELLFWERIFGDMYLALADFKNGLNIRLPGYGDVKQSLTEEMRQIIRSGCKKRFSNPDERRKVSEKAKKALSDPDLRKRISDSVKETFKDPELRKRVSHHRVKYYQNNPEARKERSEKSKQIHRDNPEVKNKCIKALNDYYKNNPHKRSEQAKARYLNKPNPRAKKIINTKTGEEFNSCKLAAKSINISEEGLRRKLIGKDRNWTDFKYK